MAYSHINVSMHPFRRERGVGRGVQEVSPDIVGGDIQLVNGLN